MKVITRNIRGVAHILLSKDEIARLHLVKGTYVFCRFNGRYLDVHHISTMTKEFELFAQVRKKGSY